MTNKDTLYLAAPARTAEENTYNQHLIALLEQFAFPVYLPALPEEGVQEAASKESCQEVLDALYNTRLMVLVCHGTVMDPVTAFEAGYAALKGVPILLLRSHLNPDADVPLPAIIQHSCTYRVESPEGTSMEAMDLLVHPLLSAINLYY